MEHGSERRPDEQIVRRILSGRREEFSTLVHRYYALVHGIAYARLRNVSDTEDVVQETFLNAFTSLPSLRERTKFRPWLLTIARNACSRFRRVHQEAAHDPESTSADTEIPPADMERRELHAILRAQVHQLEEGPREVLLLHYFTGLKAREIAEVLDISVSAAEKRLERARTALGARMVEELGAALEPDRPRREHKNAVIAAVAAMSAPWGATSVTTGNGLGIRGMRMSARFLGTHRIAVGVVALLIAGMTMWTLSLGNREQEVLAKHTESGSLQPSNLAVHTNQPPEQPSSNKTLPETPEDSAESVSMPITLSAGAVDQVHDAETEDVQPTGNALALLDVAFPDGSPAIGVQVDFVTAVRYYDEPPVQGSVHRQAVSDGKGQVQFDRLPTGAYLARAEHGDTLALAAVDVDAFTHRTLRLRRTSTITGLVCNAQGEGIEGARILVKPEEEERWFHPIDWATVPPLVAGAHGAFALTHWADDEWWTLIAADGYASRVVKLGRLAGDVELVLGKGTTVSGQVVHAQTGEPVSGVDVVLVWKELEHDRCRATTDEEGRFEHAHLHDGEYLIGVEHAELVDTQPRQLVAVAASRPVDDVLIEVEPGAVVSGRVYDEATGHGLENVKLSVSRRKVMTDSSGRYTVAGMQEGTVGIRVAPPRGYVNPDPFNNAKRLTVARGENRDDGDVALARTMAGLVRGRVVDQAGEPVPGAFVGAMDGPLRHVLERADDDGAFALQGLAITRDLRVRAALPGYASDVAGPLVLTADGLDGVELTLRPTGTVSGRVVGTSGLPVNIPYAAVVTMNAAPVVLGHSEPSRLYEGGTFRITEWPAGECQLYLETNPPDVQDNAIRRVQATANVGPGEDVTGVTIKFDDEGYRRTWAENQDPVARRQALEEARAQRLATWEIKGQVLDAKTGEPVTDYRREIRRGGITTQTTVHHDEGRFLEQQIDGPWASVVIEAVGYQPKTTVVSREAARDGIAEVVIRLEPGAVVEGIVVDPEGRPLIGAKVYAREVPLEQMELYPSKFATVQSDGSFRLNSLVPGPQRIYAEHPAHAIGWVDVAPTLERPTSTTITLTQGATVRGRVTRAGKPVSRLTVSCNHPDMPNRVASTKTDSDGQYELSCLTPGTVKVRILDADSTGVPGDGRRLSREAAAEEGKVTRVDIAIGETRSVIQGAITVHGKAPSRAWGAVEVATGSAVEHVRLEVDKTGFYRTNPAPAGAATLYIGATTPEGNSLKRILTMDVGADEIVTVDIDFTGTCSVAGNVTGVLEGEPVEIAVLPGDLPRHDSPLTPNELTADATATVRVEDGAYCITGLDPGSYTVRAVSMNALSTGEGPVRAVSAVVDLADAEALRLDFDLDSEGD